VSFAHLSAFDRVAEVGGKRRAGDVEAEVEVAPHEAAVYMCQLEVQDTRWPSLLFSPVVSPRIRRRQLRGSTLGTCSSLFGHIVEVVEGGRRCWGGSAIGARSDAPPVVLFGPVSSLSWL
jgi:hypothetical protein